MFKPAVSVIISCYNVERFIASAIHSVLNQTLQDFEIIVVDNASSDNSVEIVKKIQKTDFRISLIEQGNLGEGGARNTGIQYSRADLLAFLDGDDIWHRKKLEIQLKYFYKHKNIGLISCMTTTIDDDGFTTGWKMGRKIKGNIYHKLIEKNTIIGGSNILIPRYSFDHVGVFDTSFFCADWDIGIRIAKHFSIISIPKILVGYRRTRNNLTKDYKLIEENINKVINKSFMMDKNLSQKFYKVCLSGGVHSVSALCTVDGDFRQAWEYMKRSFKLSPLSNFRDKERFIHFVFLFLIKTVPSRILFKTIEEWIKPIMFRIKKGQSFESLQKINL